MVEHRNLRAEEMLYKTTKESSESAEKKMRRKTRGRGTRTPESHSKTPSNKARGNAGKFCAPMLTEIRGDPLPIA